MNGSSYRRDIFRSWFDKLTTNGRYFDKLTTNGRSFDKLTTNGRYFDKLTANARYRASCKIRIYVHEPSFPRRRESITR